MPSLTQGRVIYPKIPIPDPQGQNPKAGRPFVVVSTNEDIKQAHNLHAVGITTTFDESETHLYVPLPHGPTARSGLKRESAAVCSWVIEISPDQVEIGSGYIHPSLIDQIAEKIEKLGATPQRIRSKPDGNSD